MQCDQAIHVLSDMTDQIKIDVLVTVRTSYHHENSALRHAVQLILI
jgi:hypothetical protein